MRSSLQSPYNSLVDERSITCFCVNLVLVGTPSKISLLLSGTLVHRLVNLHLGGPELLLQERSSLDLHPSDGQDFHFRLLSRVIGRFSCVLVACPSLGVTGL